jgi:hypothetical protein
LFGEMGLPDHVEKTNAPDVVSFGRTFHFAINCIAVSDNGICRTAASVFGVLNAPS